MVRVGCGKRKTPYTKDALLFSSLMQMNVSAQWFFTISGTIGSPVNGLQSLFSASLRTHVIASGGFAESKVWVILFFFLEMLLEQDLEHCESCMKSEQMTEDQPFIVLCQDRVSSSFANSP